MPNPEAPGSPDGNLRDDRLRNVWQADPGALGGRPSRPLSISFPAVEHAIIQLGKLSAPFGRRLLREEKQLLDEFYRGSIDTDRIRVVETPVANAPTTLGNQIRVEPGKSLTTAAGKTILIHEAMHVWQYQTQGTRYISCSIVHQVAAQIETGTRNGAYYGYTLDARRSISDYPAEQQAQIVEDYYSLTYRFAGPRAHLPRWVQQRRGDMAHYERLMRQVRAAVPRTQEQIYSDSLMQPPRPDLFPEPTDPSQRFVPLIPFLRVEFD